MIPERNNSPINEEVGRKISEITKELNEIDVNVVFIQDIERKEKGINNLGPLYSTTIDIEWEGKQ